MHIKHNNIIYYIRMTKNITKDLLMANNCRLRSTGLDLLLTIREFDGYVYEKKIKFVEKSKIAKEELKNYIKVERKG